MIQNNMTVPITSAQGQKGIPVGPRTENGFPTMPARQINRQMSIDVVGVLRIENRNTSNHNPQAASIIHEWTNGIARPSPAGYQLNAVCRGRE